MLVHESPLRVQLSNCYFTFTGLLHDNPIHLSLCGWKRERKKKTSAKELDKKKKQEVINITYNVIEGEEKN